MAGFCDSLHTILSVVLQFSLTFYLFSVAKSTGIFQSVLIRLLFTPCPATRCAMHRIYANRINSCDMSRVFCDLRSHKTPRGILPVNSNLIRAGSAIQSLAFFSFSLYNVTVQSFTVTSQNAFIITFGDGILACMSRDFGIFMPKHLAVQWLLNSYSTIYIGICFVNSMTVFYRSCCYHQILQMISHYTV